MLRIKKGIDLKELEKYGFECIENRYYISRPLNYTWWDNTIRLEVSKDRRIHYNNPNIKTFDKLYDLIKADLVEKVDE